jgi:serine/threonine-protein kinase RIM15
MGCRCVVVADGSEAVSIANGDVRFDVIMLDLNMPISECDTKWSATRE